MTFEEFKKAREQGTSLEDIVASEKATQRIPNGVSFDEYKSLRATGKSPQEIMDEMRGKTEEEEYQKKGFLERLGVDIANLPSFWREELSNPENPFAGVVKGFGSFGAGVGISPFQTTQKAISGVLGKQQQKTQESMRQFQAVADRILEAAQQTTDPEKKKQLLELAQEAFGKIDTSRNLISETTSRLGELSSSEITGELRPMGTAQELGYLGEKIGEFLLPTRYINVANKILGAGVAATGLSKMGTGGKIISTGINIAGRVGTEAGSAYGISKFQGATNEEAESNAKLAAYISGGIGVLGALGGATGGKFMDMARRIYSSGLKPSTAGPKGVQHAKEVVETGLREGIVLSGRGVQKTAETISELESHLDDAIRIAAAKGSNEFIFVPDLKSYIDEVKGIVANTLDVAGSARAGQQIDELYNNLIGKYGMRIPIKEAQNLKVATYKVLRDSYDQLANPLREGLKQLTRGVKEGILEAAPKTGEINSRLSALYKFDEALNKANARIQNLNLLGLGSKILAATGGKAGAILGIIDAVLGSPTAKSRIGITIYRLGNLLQKLSPEQISQISASPGVKAFLERAFGSSRKLTEEELRYLNAIKEYIDNPRIGLSLEDVSKRGMGVAGTPETAGTFQGLKGGLSTKLLEKFRGMPEEITPQQFNEVINRAQKEGIRKADLDMIKEAAERQGAVSDISKAKASGQSFDEWVKGQGAEDFVYHTTYLKNLESVKTGGLKPQGERRLYFSQDAKSGANWGNEGDPLFRTLRKNVSELETDPGAYNTVSTKKTVSPDLLEVSYNKGKTWKSLTGKSQIKTHSQLKAEWDKGGKINLTNLAKDIETQLVPLTPTPVKSPRWSNVGEDFIGDGKYGEIVYQSPIKTSAGNVHFNTGSGQFTLGRGGERIPSQDFPNYFSHVRYEDMADGKTRKILETQSDLMQKGRLSNEIDMQTTQSIHLRSITKNKIVRLQDDLKGATSQVRKDFLKEEIKRLQDSLEGGASRVTELSKLSAYSSNDPLAHLRTFREEVKRAAKDGKDTLLIPNGRTAMEIEGLGVTQRWTDKDGMQLLTAELKIGKEIRVAGTDGENWIITDVLGDGKFKAVPKNTLQTLVENRDIKFDTMDIEDALSYINQHDKVQLNSAIETFDISGKVDTKHFVYKLNEEAIPKEARKQGLIVEGKITQDNGEWWKIKIPKERAKMPVEAFGILPIAVPQEQE